VYRAKAKKVTKSLRESPRVPNTFRRAFGIEPSGAYEEGLAGMLTIIKASLLASALMLLESCTGYLTSYQTPCVEGHVCECVRYTTVNRSWLDCRDYGRVKSRAY
jgi:hypothetical protein